MRWIRKYFLAWLVIGMALGFTQVTQAAVTLIADLEPAAISLDEEATLIVTVTMDGGGRIPIPLKPRVTGLTIIENPTLTKHRAVAKPGGGIETVKSFGYDVIADDEGIYDIPGFKILLGGIEYKSRGVRLTVGRTSYSSRPQTSPQPSPYGSQTPPQPDPDDPVSSNNNGGSSLPYWIRVTVDKKAVVKSEQILFTFKLFTQENIELGEFLLPALDDFWVEELVKEKRGTATVNGRQFATLEKSYALFPLKTGDLTIDETQLKIQIAVYDPSVGNWGPFVIRRGKIQMETKTLKSDAIDVRVDDFPSPVPADFTGLVGNFDVRAALSGTEVAVGEPLTLNLEFSGQGNIKDAILPAFHIPDVKVYEDKPLLDLMTSSAGVSGTKSFKMALMPTKPGKFVVPQLSMSYYDPGLGQYVALNVDELRFAVTGEENSATAITTVVTGPDAMATGDLRALSADPTLAFLTTPAAWPHTVVILLTTLPVAAFLILVVARRRKPDRTVKRKSRLKTATRQLRAALSNQTAGAEEILKSVRNFLAQACDVSGSLTAVEAEESLLTSGVPPGTAQSFRECLEGLEASQYGMGDEHDHAAKIAALQTLLGEVQKYL
jgi:hypothetical protein